jgi:hypothetical protein
MWLYRLWHDDPPANACLSFTGVQTDAPKIWPDSQHSGVTGEDCGTISTRVTGTLASGAPNIGIVIAGTNEILVSAETPAQGAANYETMMNDFDGAVGDAEWVVTSLPDVNPAHGSAANLASMNALLATARSNLTGAGLSLHFADVRAAPAYNAGKWNGDGLHWNTTGATEAAATILAALTSAVEALLP